MSNKFNLSEAAAEILNRSIASAKAGADTASKRLPTSVVPGMKEVGDIGTQVLKTTDGGPDATRGVGSATPPGATPPVGAEPMKKLKGQPAEQGSAEQPEGKAGRQMMAKNPGATFQSYGGQNEEIESDEETIEEEEKKKSPFDDMMKAAKERQGPQPSGGSGKKMGSRYGGSKQKNEEVEKGEKEEGHEDEKEDKAMMKKMMSKKNMKEDIDALLQGENLSEEFVQKATTIFEAAVNSRVQEISEQLQEELEGQFVEALEQVKEDFATKIDDYMNYVVEEWMKENELAIESGLRAEIVEDFIGGLHNLFAEHYINIPDEKVEIVEEMAEKVEELEEKLNEEMQKVVEFRKELNEAKKFQAVQAVCEGLTQTQAEKLKSLAESVEFTSEEDFAEKLETLKEAYIPKKHKTAEKSALEEGVEIEEKTQQSSVDPLINAVVNSISKSVAK